MDATPIRNRPEFIMEDGSELPITGAYAEDRAISIFWMLSTAGSW